MDSSPVYIWSTEMYDNEQSSGSMPLFTLSPGGCDRSVIKRHFPVLWPFGITPKRLTWRAGRMPRSFGAKGPSRRPTDRSLSSHGVHVGRDQILVTGL